MRSSRLRLSAGTPPSSSSVKTAENVSTKSGGALDALQHTGIPVGWLKRPKLPSRNWLIFWGVVSGLSYLYWDDRRQCRRIKDEYVSKVRHLAEVPLGSMELPRKVDVYACKWPGDEEYDRSLKFFKRYVKPVLVAAAVDYTHKNGNVYGAISELIRDKAKEQRREQLGILPPASPWSPPTAVDKQKEHERWMEGGTILIGRHTFKEYMHGLRQGWTESLQAVDAEEVLANRLSEDGRFDEPEEPFALDPSSNETGSSDDSPPSSSSPALRPSPTARPPSSLFAPLTRKQQPSSQSSLSESTPAVPESLTQIPESIPIQPPILLVYYPNRLGFLNIPLIIADFFNERKNVRIGCEAAYKLVMNESRPFIPPTSTIISEDEGSSSLTENGETETTSVPGSSGSAPGLMGHGGDADFAVDSEDNFGKSFAKLPKTTAKARESYYKELPDKLKLARALARGEREPTKDEQAYPPSTEVELRSQRLSKEKKWTSDEESWKWLRAGSGVTWDERFDGALRVFTAPVEAETSQSSSALSDSSPSSGAA